MSPNIFHLTTMTVLFLMSDDVFGNMYFFTQEKRSIYSLPYAFETRNNLHQIS